MNQSLRDTTRQTVCTPSQRSTRESKSMISNISFSIYKSTVNRYKQFLTIFQDRLQNVYSKQNYRIYLNDKRNEKIYRQLIKQKDELVKALQDSKDYKQSANRALIEQVMNLQKLKEQYQSRNNECQLKINNKKKESAQKKKQLKKLQAQIKSYWIYNYDITTTSMNSSITQKSSQIHSETRNQRLLKLRQNNQSQYSKVSNSRVQTVINEDKSVIDSDKLKDSNIKSDKQNTITQQSNKQNNKQKNLIICKQNTLHLPYIGQHNRNQSTLRCSSNYSNYQYQLPQSKYSHATTTILSKDLSLINSSLTKQKILAKIQSSNKQRGNEKLEYQRQKLNLLKFFKMYLQKSSQSQQNFTQRKRLQKIVLELQERINIKQQILKQIQSLLLSN